MRKILLQIVLLVFCLNLTAQQPGDTIVVKAFKYGSPRRDTLINFPNNPNLTFEKIILKYNMRCKNNLVSTTAQRNLGCGEWDYSCNTFIVDSTKIDFRNLTAPSHVIAGFTGSVFPYSTQAIYDYYTFTQTQVTVNNIVSETQHTVGTGTTPAPNVFKTNERSGRTQLLYTAAELISSGLTAGTINGFIANVINAGGGVNFLRVGIQQTTLSTLGSGTLSASGFTNVFNSNYTLTPGNNRIQFYTPFVWNGTSNILLDLSFTNNIPSNPAVLSGALTTSVMALYSNNNYALDLASFGSATLAMNNLSSINNQLTVAFWAYGDAAQMPTNTSLLWGYSNNPAERNLNLHLPWSDNSMYFDCGYSAGGYDRINKVATAAQQGGQWNHWAFTKNSSTGVMTIYLNGVQWHTGSAKTKPISILNLILGVDNNQNNNWKGKINQLAIWNAELSASTISAWMNKEITASHPLFANLVAYYKMKEGSGLVLTESINNVNVTGVNLQWTNDWGNTLTNNCMETNVRPNLVFVKGTYALTTSTVMVTDSIRRNLSIVRTFSVVSNASVTPLTSDQVIQSGTLFLYSAAPRKIYNGDTGVLTGTLATVAQNTIIITSLNYLGRFPYYNEIMSFVTPYGINLNLGANGKTWYFDLTDFTPILKGPKRLLMTMGGEFQEQMDLDFWFIVGTPPRNVIEFNQLWQGAAALGGIPISRINNDSQFAVKTVTIPAAGQTFKIRSTITGHGSQGEFKANGGTINHFFNVDGGPNEFTWQITERCSRNVIYPQGGTWIYDREGWCPGQASLLKEFYIDPYVTPGSTVTLDYNCSNPPNPNGDYNYKVANQLVSYGAPNHSLDANLVDVLKPSNKVLYSRENPMCANPVILIQNTGSTSITSLEINYKINSGTPLSYTWTGNLAYLDTAVITLPISTLWQNVSLSSSGNTFEASIVSANSTVDQYSYNNVYRSAFSSPFAITNSFDIDFRTNNNFTENSYVVYDDMGNTLGQSNFSAPNTSYLDSYQFDGCCRLAVEDSQNNGLSWFAAAAQGTGFVRLRNASGSIVKTFDPDFGGGFEFSFVTFNPLSINKFDFSNRLNLFPNPGRSKFTLSGDGLEDAEIVMVDVLGHQVNVKFRPLESGAIEMSTDQLAAGIYFVNVKRGDTYTVKKVIIN